MSRTDTSYWQNPNGTPWRKNVRVLSTVDQAEDLSWEVGLNPGTASELYTALESITQPRNLLTEIFLTAFSHDATQDLARQNEVILDGAAYDHVYDLTFQHFRAAALVATDKEAHQNKLIRLYYRNLGIVIPAEAPGED